MSKQNTLDTLLQGRATGQEGVSPDDLRVGRLNLAQKMTPQADPHNPKAIPGLEPGDFFLGDIALGQEVTFLACTYRKRYVHWGDREKNEGVKAVFDSLDDVVALCGPGAYADPTQRIVADGPDAGDRIRETAYWLGYVKVDDRLEECYLAMDSTKLQQSRQWLAITRQYRLADGSLAPLYSRAYQLKSFNQQGVKHNWSNLKAAPGVPLDVLAKQVGRDLAGLVDQCATVAETADEQPMVRVRGATTPVAALGAGDPDLRS